MYYHEKVDYLLIAELEGERYEVRGFCTDQTRGIFQITVVHPDGQEVLSVGMYSFSGELFSDFRQAFEAATGKVTRKLRFERIEQEGTTVRRKLLVEDGITLHVGNAVLHDVKVQYVPDKDVYQYVVPGVTCSPDETKFRQLQYDPESGRPCWSEHYTAEQFRAASEEDALYRWEGQPA